MTLENLYVSWAVTKRPMKDYQILKALESAIMLNDRKALENLLANPAHYGPEFNRIVQESDNLEALAIWFHYSSAADRQAFLEVAPEDRVIELIYENTRFKSEDLDLLWARKSAPLRRELILCQSFDSKLSGRWLSWLLKGASQDGFFEDDLEPKEEYFARLGGANEDISKVVFDKADEEIRCFLADGSQDSRSGNLGVKLLSHFAEKQEVAPLDEVSIIRFLTYLASPILLATRRRKDETYSLKVVKILKNIKNNLPTGVSLETKSQIDGLLAEAASSGPKITADLTPEIARTELKTLKSNGSLGNAIEALVYLFQEYATDRKRQDISLLRGAFEYFDVALESIDKATLKRFWKKTASHPLLDAEEALCLCLTLWDSPLSEQEKETLYFDIFKSRSKKWLNELGASTLNGMKEKYTPYGSWTQKSDRIHFDAISYLSEEDRIAFYQGQVKNIIDLTRLCQVVPSPPFEVLANVFADAVEGNRPEAACDFIFEAANHYLGDDPIKWENFDKLGSGFSGSFIDLFKVSSILAE